MQSLENFQPTSSQIQTIYIIGIYIGVILVLWNLPILKQILWPFKIFTVGLHESGHALMGWCTGAKILGITLDPDEGGATRMKGGNPYVTLPAGYIGSSVWGALMVFAGFNTFASKIVSIAVGLALMIILFTAKNWLARIMTLLFIGLGAFLWWFENAFYLRYFILFLGVMSSMYSLFDIVEDLISRRVNESDASKYAKLCCNGCLGPRVWGLIWLLISVLFLASAILAALVVFKEDPNATVLKF